MLSLHAIPNPDQFHFAIVPKSVGHIVGGVNIRIMDQTHQAGSIGYALDSDYRGQGYMTEAVEAMLKFGFQTLSLHRIWAYADTRNEKSRQIMERLGLQREGVLRDHKLVRGKWRDSYIYAILKPDWDLHGL